MIEYWDLYDENRKPIGKIHKQGTLLKSGEYHLVAEIWVVDTKGKILITKRHPDKHFGELWECTSGSIVANESSKMGAVRELEEEIGIRVEENRLEQIHSFRMGNSFYDTYVVKLNIEQNDLRLQENEVIDAKWVNFQELVLLCEANLVVPTLVSRLGMYKAKFLEIVKELQTS